MQNLKMSWQSDDLNMKERLSHLMTSRQMTDVTLIIGQEKEYFPTRSLLLSIHSEVFHAMFYGPLAEKRKNVTLPDDDAKAFRVFIKYIYTEEVALHSVDEAIRSLHFAEKYMVTRMKNQCLSHLTNHIWPDTVLEIYEAASQLQQNELTMECWMYITDNMSEIIKRDSIKNVKYETILKLVSVDCLVLKSEVDMYDAVIKWGKERFQDQSPEDLRKKLEPLLDQIRFLSMTPAEFAESPCQDGILTKDEQVDIFREIATKKNYENNNIRDQWRKPRQIIATLKMCTPRNEYNRYMRYPYVEWEAEGLEALY
ncbi:BTB/POZ domain-containing protein 2-like [Centruroides sculpturatus]|uniref:BTB/POZ domain-containing protein 2-like n=1 Tax=Centruroides sculpturatus TaxID=218467 RepID=UPI000C6E6A1A|nr:BTB/POZ domain-containing protein 2-like [Centruroides sculpturatus]